jgi:hypothetical protein
MIGKMERVDLREVWKNEARDFTSWLFDNIDILGDELNVSITPIEKEKRVGSFSADILAESEEGDPILIENQLQKTNHDHLGKLLTYVSNLEAKKAIWISKEPRSEHERAIEWLNELTSDVDFYLVKIEAYKIGDSDPAPKFTVIAGPTESGKVVGSEKKELAERHKKRLKFWEGLLKINKNKTKYFSNCKPKIYYYTECSSGISGFSYYYAIKQKSASIGLTINKGEKDINNRIFNQLLQNKDEIEKSFGEKLSWFNKEDIKSSWIYKEYKYAGLKDEDKWGKLQEKMVDGMVKITNAFDSYLKKIN